jgi:hypothetical protein
MSKEVNAETAYKYFEFLPPNYLDEVIILMKTQKL